MRLFLSILVLVLTIVNLICAIVYAKRKEPKLWPIFASLFLIICALLLIFTK
jgi:hypothetical protein